ASTAATSTGSRMSTPARIWRRPSKPRYHRSHEAAYGRPFRLGEDDVPEFPPLESFGDRIMVCGPSNAGKSTLAVALGNKLGLPFVHLDLLHHVPRSNWVTRPREEFVALHDEAITGESWVMDGNYQGLFPKRLARTTGIILLTDNRW